MLQDEDQQKVNEAMNEAMAREQMENEDLDNEQLKDDITQYEDHAISQLIASFEQIESSEDTLEGYDSAEDYNTDTDDGRNDDLELDELNDKLYQTIARLRFRNENLRVKNQQLIQKTNGIQKRARHAIKRNQYERTRKGAQHASK